MEQNIRNNTDAAPVAHGNINSPLAVIASPTTLRGFDASGCVVGFTSQTMPLRKQGRLPNHNFSSNLSYVLDLPAPRALAGLHPLYPPPASTQ